MNIRGYKYHLMRKNKAPSYFLRLYACNPKGCYLVFTVHILFLMWHLCRGIGQRWQDTKNM